MILDNQDKQLITRLCEDLGDDLYPFRAIAEELNMPEADVLERIQRLKASGALRRLGAILRHQKAGMTANGMSVWNVPDADIARVADALTACPEITHCYERPRLPDWPYNLFGMIHAKSEDDCRAVAARVAEITGITDYDVLFSIREFKKTSMKYF